MCVRRPWSRPNSVSMGTRGRLGRWGSGNTFQNRLAGTMGAQCPHRCPQFIIDSSKNHVFSGDSLIKSQRTTFGIVPQSTCYRHLPLSLHDWKGRAWDPATVRNRSNSSLASVMENWRWATGRIEVYLPLQIKQSHRSVIFDWCALAAGWIFSCIDSKQKNYPWVHDWFLVRVKEWKGITREFFALPSLSLSSVPQKPESAQALKAPCIKRYLTLPK